MATTARKPTPHSMHPTRRLGLIRAPIVATAMLMAVSACASDDDGASVLGGDEYVSAMNAVCADTESLLAGLPEPPEQISAADWAGEVARAFRAEQTAADELVVDESIRELHRSYTLTTDDLAASYGELSVAFVDAPDDIGDVSTTITELSLGRDDVASELGLDVCVRSER